MYKNGPLDMKQEENKVEESMNATGQTTQAENMGKESEVQGSAQEGKGKEQKLFTQDEVNGFVQSRIARLKGQMEKEIKAEYEQKLTELQARERKLLIKEKLDERGMSRDLADIITCTDEEDLKNKLDKLYEIYGEKVNVKQDPVSGFKMMPSKGLKVGCVPSDGTGAYYASGDPVRMAMGLNRKE